MKKIFTLCFLLASSVMLYAQPVSMSDIDKILLKDGSNLVGQIIEQSDEKISFQILGGPIVHIDKENIDKINKGEEVENKKGRIYFPSGKSISTRGVYGTLHIGSNWTSNPTVDGNFGGLAITSSYGFHFNRFFSLGGGTGVEIINGPNFNTYTFVPVYAEVRGYPFPDKKIGPYYALNMGYAFGWDLFDSFDGTYTGGINIEPRIGLRFASHKRGQFYVEAGYKYQTTNSDYRRTSFFEGSTFIKEDIQFFRPTLNFGWLF